MKRFLVLAMLLLTGCASSPTPSYDPAAFSCTLAIDSVSTGEEGRFTGRYVCENGSSVLTLTAPERLAGVVFAFSGEDCILTADGCDIPLSRSVSDSLACLTGLLSLPPEEALDTRRTDDGTVLLFEGGQVTFDEAGLPVLAETTDGRRAAVTMDLPEMES